jgi:hypothetical protein
MTSGSTHARKYLMRQFAVLLIGGCAILSTGCVTTGLFDWSRDEVTIAGHKLRVKNVEKLPDDFYEIVGPASWPEQQVVEADDGILSLSPPIELSLTKGRGGPGAIDFREMDLSEARQPFSPRGEVVMATVACIDRGPDRNYRVQVLRGDSSRQRWVRIGTIEIGHGTQSAARAPLSWVALPVTAVVDLVTVPFLLVGAILMGSAEGISALTSD